MSKIIKTPAGVKEYLPKNFQKFQSMRQTIEESYRSFGFLPLETSPMQYLSTLSSGGEISKEIYSIGRAKAEDNSSEDNRGLRFDLTKPLARYVAEFQNDIIFPLKRMETGLVYRGERPQKGRDRQFYQADFDIIARESLSADYDAEIIQVAASTFEKLGLDVVIRINNRKLLKFLLERNGVEADFFNETLILIDKIDKVGVQKTMEDIIALTGTPVENAHTLVNFISKKIEKENVSDFLQRLQLDQETLKEIEDIFNILPDFEHVKIVLDMSIARGLDYYTGTVFETNIVGLEKYGSVCSGGRYENLVGEFSDKKFPGVGGSIGLSRLFAILENEKVELEIWNRKDDVIFIAIAEENRLVESHKLAQKLRNEGKIVNVAPKDMKFKKQFEVAGKMEVDTVLILEDGGMVTEKDMKTGRQILKKGF